ncbi:MULTISPECIES: hypothetical protein [Streptomyces]|uniref:Phenazine biosynthesis PhzC/PhzF protein n=1 Tax=Streptomyces albus (strain ATCC 21838 / DSM 41398 / FERM P-419 / JCM 4703 / NBRC 107858) TaxID=1081613 RepID=A0A0B5EGS9_STRA4|nr:hypothetical protein [Streptomyces sp. SCSIO ZS0520]AJE80579.1 phenazine biosynthesis PhzC/PhzF protein [Streptomyces albus]AOU74893.1 phenazine biosynthesis PhzC/PhzF protein [Streptomyces albus]AYN30703.1 hypothetical protein DUI70_0200 [Streptomyces albus]
MRAVVVWWDLEGSGQTISALRGSLEAEGAASWERVEGLCLKLWVADPTGNRWGAVMVWEREVPPVGSLPANRAAELIGSPPTVRVEFEVEAAVAGSAWGALVPQTEG